jgi:hypothetical protein
VYLVSGHLAIRTDLRRTRQSELCPTWTPSMPQ